MVISKAAADRLFPGEDPIGKCLDFTGNGELSEIVGIAGDVRHYGLAAPVDIECYEPMTQVAHRWFVVAVRSPRTAEMLREIPDVVAGIDPEQSVTAVRRMEERVAQTIGARRFTALLLGAFAAAALVLATIGLFGLVSYTTGQRTRELGIRVALGSTPERILAIVMRDGMKLLGIGLVLGGLGAIAIGRAVAPHFDRATAFDGPVFGGILGVLALAGLIASLLPALRAVRIPPAAALRHE
jgi:ABC-type antimicrobial peptide transport system permease subunit